MEDNFDFLKEKMPIPETIELYRSTLEQAIQRKINSKITVKYYGNPRGNNWAFMFYIGEREVGGIEIYDTNFQTTRRTGKPKFSYNHFHVHGVDKDAFYQNQKTEK